MEDEYIAVYEYQNPSDENPEWIWRGTLGHIAALGLEPVMASKKLVPVADIDETGKYLPERGTGQQ